jgi:hypothetical protein
MKARNVGPLIVDKPRVRLRLWHWILIATLIAIGLSLEEREEEQAAIQYVCSDSIPGCATNGADVPGGE